MLIGVCGRKRSGKDTFGNYVSRAYENFETYAFADPLKRVCMVLFDFSHEQMYDGKAKETNDSRWGCTPRHVMQIVGTEICRNVLPTFIPQMNNIEGTFWIRHFLTWYRKKQNSDNVVNVVVTDVRFLDEAQAIRNQGGIIVKIESDREGVNLDTHASEVELSNIVADYVLTNNGTKDQFYESINDLWMKF